MELVRSVHIVSGNEDRTWLGSGERMRIKDNIQDLGVGAVKNSDTLLIYLIAAMDGQC